ncbi:MAG: hypothetical protein EOM26_01705 [Alphaproteobacteria bacterium]|nr:hypothetical protein [Alphaproteobacteria bacterium]
MYSISVTGYSSEAPRKAIQAALCRMAELLEKGALLSIFPPGVEQNEEGIWCAEILANVAMRDGGDAGRAHEALELKKIIDADVFVRLVPPDDKARLQTIRDLLTHLEHFGVGELSARAFTSLDKEQALDLQHHIQRDFSDAGEYMIVPNSPTPHRVWPVLTEG